MNSEFKGWNPRRQPRLVILRGLTPANHPMFGSISAWFIRHLGGIQAADDAVGFDRIVIRPQTGHGLEWVKSSHRSVRGMIESNT